MYELMLRASSAAVPPARAAQSSRGRYMRVAATTLVGRRVDGDLPCEKGTTTVRGGLVLVFRGLIWVIIRLSKGLGVPMSRKGLAPRSVSSALQFFAVRLVVAYENIPTA